MDYPYLPETRLEAEDFLNISLDLLITIWHSMLSNRHNRPKRSKSGKEVGNKYNETRQDKLFKRNMSFKLNNVSIFCCIWCHKPNKCKLPRYVMLADSYLSIGENSKTQS